MEPEPERIFFSNSYWLKFVETLYFEFEETRVNSISFYLSISHFSI
jgi:hypothetical protein